MDLRGNLEVGERERGRKEGKRKKERKGTGMRKHPRNDFLVTVFSL